MAKHREVERGRENLLADFSNGRNYPIVVSRGISSRRQGPSIRTPIDRDRSLLPKLYFLRVHSFNTTFYYARYLDAGQCPMNDRNDRNFSFGFFSTLRVLVFSFGSHNSRLLV